MRRPVLPLSPMATVIDAYERSQLEIAELRAKIAELEAELAQLGADHQARTPLGREHWEWR